MKRLFAVLAILVLISLVGCAGKSETSPGEVKIEIPKDGATAPAAPAETPDGTQAIAPAEETQDTVEQTATATKTCGETAALGYKPGSCTLVDNDAELKITKSDKGDVDSLKIYYVESDTVLGTAEVSGPINAGSEQTIKLELSKYSPKGVKIVPVIGGEECTNQQLYLPMSSCS